MLVRDGKILADGKAEGFSEDKINKNAAQRSFAGVTKDNILIMGTVSGVSVKQLAEIIKKLGVLNGINLDGGASSGLYYKGSYITNPGRKISNALVVTKLKQKPLRIKINKNEEFFSKEIYMNKAGTAMVPMKDFFKAFGAITEMNLKNKTFTANRFDKILSFSLGSDSIILGGQALKMSYPIELRNNTFFAPLDSLADFMKAKVDIDKKDGIINVSVDYKNEQETKKLAEAAFAKKDHRGAEQKYLQILEYEPKNIGAMLKLAEIYDLEKNHAKKALYLGKYLDQAPRYTHILKQYAWSSYSAKEYGNAIKAFEKLTKEFPGDAIYPKTILQCYGENAWNSYKNKDYLKSIELYNQLIKLDPTNADKYRTSLANCYSYYRFTFDENTEYLERIKKFEELILKYTDNINVWITLGELYRDDRIRKYSEAADCYKKALTLNPTDEQRSSLEKRLNDMLRMN